MSLMASAAVSDPPLRVTSMEASAQGKGFGSVLEEDRDFIGHVTGDGHHLHGASGTPGARFLVGASAAEDVAAAGEEEGRHGGPGLEVLDLDEALHAMEPFERHLEVRRFFRLPFKTQN